MGRTIITKADVEKESSEGLERLEVAGDEVETAIALGLAPIKSSPPSKRAVSPDAYLDRLVKYIPSEVIATYLSLDLICRSAIEMWPGWLVLGFGCLATPVYLSVGLLRFDIGECRYSRSSARFQQPHGSPSRW